MLKNFKKIKNIGRFYDVSIENKGNCTATFKKFNLIYADNGTGKSTITTILKSLWENDAQRLIEKRTIGATGKSFVELNVDNKTYKFENNKWNKTPEIDLKVFDEEFVEKNVFVLSKIEPTNRRKLLKHIVLGEENVGNIKKIEELNDLLKGELKDKIEQAETRLKRDANIIDIAILDRVVPLNNEALEAMKNRVHHTKKIIDQEERIKNENKLNTITDFEYIKYKESISADIKSLSLDAEYRAHIQEHNSWIKGGMNIVENGDESSCPFCFQNIEGNRPIATYKAFFSKEYEDLRDKVANQIDSAERIYSDAVISNVINLIARNNERCVFWHNLDKEIPESVALAVSLAEATQTFKHTLKALLERKKGNLLDAIVPNEHEKQDLGQEAYFRQAIADYNTGIDKINTKIQAIKDASQDIEELDRINKNEQIKLACNNVRYRNPKTAEIYKNLKQYKQERNQIKEEKIKLRNEIDKESKSILKKYQNNINKELINFDVDFTIQEVGIKPDTASKDGVHFNICLEGKNFNPNGSSKYPYKLSNTLSSGDKSTLAFAFFIAKYREKDISNQILVFDDPITSLDFFRESETQKIIKNFADNALQVIVLTHSINFAKSFDANNGGNYEKRFVWIRKNYSEKGLSYTPYNKFSDMGIDKHSRDYELINKYTKDPASVETYDVVRSIRPYVETILKNDPYYGFASLSLGKIIRKLRDQGTVCKDYIHKLEDINDNTVAASHGRKNKDDANSKKMTDNKLMSICRLALSITPPPKN